MTSRQHEFKNTDTYKADPALASMVDLALKRGRPLLLTGEAGTGKTQLAYAIADSLDTCVHRAQMTSTMEGEEVCYKFDSVLRLTDSQIAGKGVSTNGRDVSDPMCYVRHGAFGKAFTADKPTVVLLDEIDKTDSDVQDDLLRVLESYEFDIREAGKTIKAKHDPVVIITSNGKRELSDPFLRRCYAHHIDFPDSDQMGEIAMMHYPELTQNLKDHAVGVVYELREAGLEKPPATSELLEWIGALTLAGAMPPSSIHSGESIPYMGVLLKRRSDLEKFTGQNTIARRSRRDRVGGY